MPMPARSRLLLATLIASSLLAALAVATAMAQVTQDFVVSNVCWSNLPGGDSVRVSYTVTVVGPVSSDTLNPTINYIPVRILFNGTPVEVDHELERFSWTHQDVFCFETDPCAVDKVCRKEVWEYKGGRVTQNVKCALAAPPISCHCPQPVPVPHDKDVHKPTVEGTFKVILDPDNLYPETNETNNTGSAAYSVVPSLTSPGLLVVVALLVATGMVVVSRRRFGAA
jgi:hypothetical protein